MVDKRLGATASLKTTSDESALQSPTVSYYEYERDVYLTQMCVGCLRLLTYKVVYRHTRQQHANKRTLPSPNTQSIWRRIPSSPPSLLLCPAVIDWTRQYSEEEKKHGAHCLHLLIRASLSRARSLSLSLSADLNYTSFYQASQGSTPAAALFIKCTVQIHTSKLMRENQAVNQTPAVSKLISWDSKLCPSF